jgi:PAS domain S-box-containing protein
MSKRQVQDATLDTILQRAFASWPVGVAACIAEDSPVASMIVYVNPAYCALSGFSAEVLVAHSALLLGGARPDARSVRRLSSASVAEDLHVTVTKWRPDGTSYRAQTAVLPLRSSQGEVSHFLALEAELVPAQAAGRPRAASGDAPGASLAARVLATVGQSLASSAARYREALWSLRSAEYPETKLEVALSDALAHAEGALEAVRRLTAGGTEHAPPDALCVHGAVALLVDFTRRDLCAEAEIVRNYGRAGRPAGRRPREGVRP